MDISEKHRAEPEGLSGRLLVALPGIGDPRFERSVIALAHHDAHGALGLCLHDELEGFGMAELLAELDIAAPDPVAAPVHRGGPVEPQRGFVLHSPDWRGEGTLPVGERLALTATRDVLAAIAEGSGPGRALVTLGYAGWAEGQLEDELKHHAWLVCEADDALLFETPAAERWQRALAALGVDPAHLSATGGRA